MKNIAFLTGVLSAMIVMGTHETSGQYTWTKDPGNPVLSGGGTGAWDANVGVPWVLFNADSGRFEMWYTGSPPNCRIGFAVSNDGISWTKDTDPVLNPTPGTWDSLLVAGPCVLRESGQYRMWYTGAREPSGGSQLGLDRIGYATSPDGRHWTKYAGNPVLGPGAAPWESKGVEFCSVLPVDGGYQMYYGGFSTTGVSLIGRAFSTDGITWKRDTSNNPVLNIGAPGAWDQQVYLPRVLALGGRDYIWYTAEAVPGGGSSKIGLATSTDGGKTWTRYDAAPVVSDGPSGSWDAEYVEIGSVLAKDGMVQMWYDGGRAPEYTARVGHATAHRLDPMVLHVPSQYGTIQSAIDAAIKGDTVLVDHGTYFQNIRYRGKAIVVGSRYLLDGDTAHISRTVIDGSKPANPDSASVVSFVSGEDTGSVLCGFTITGGTGILGSFGVGIEYRGGGGVFCKGSGAILKHNFIRGNTLEGLASYHCVGAGVFADSGAGSPAPLLRLEDNIITGNSATATNLSIGGVGVFLYRINALLHGNAITDNTGITASTSTWVAGGGIYCEQSTLVCQDNLIARNKAVATQLSGTAHASGGGMAAEAVNLDFRRNRVIDNLAQGPASPGAWGGGILVFAANTSELRNIAISGNWFSGNQALGGSGASGGGIDVWNQKPRIENNMIVKNEAYNGGGIGIHGSLESSPAVAVNNTISDNNATMGGGARFRNGTIAVAFNNIFWADSATSSGPEIEASNER